MGFRVKVLGSGFRGLGFVEMVMGHAFKNVDLPFTNAKAALALQACAPLQHRRGTRANGGTTTSMVRGRSLDSERGNFRLLALRY